MKHYLAIFLLITIALPCLAQEDVTTKKQYTFMQKHFFSGCTFAVIYDFWFAPASFDTSDTRGIGSGERDYTVFNIASCAFDLRLNIVDFNERSSCSFNFPVTAGLGAGGAGFGTVYFPFLLQFNYGYHSTFNNIDHKGFTVGGGYMLIKFPLFPGDRHDTRTWGDVVVKAGYKTDSREIKNFELMTGVLNGFSVRFGFGLIFGY